MAAEFVKPNLSLPVRFRPEGLNQIMILQEELDVLDEAHEKPVYIGTLEQAKKWITELTSAVRECENLEARKRAERRSALEREIAERRAELEELARIDGAPVPAAPASYTVSAPSTDAPPFPSHSLPADPSIPMPAADPSIPPPPAQGKKAPQPYRNTNGMGQPDSRPC